jgi:hypothetical protein
MRALISPALIGLFVVAVAAGCGGGTSDGTGDAATDAGTDQDSVEGCFELSDGACVVETFKNPPTLAPNADGVYELELVPTEFSFAGSAALRPGLQRALPGAHHRDAAPEGGAPRQVRVNLRNASPRATCARSASDVSATTTTHRRAACPRATVTAPAASATA